MLGTGPRPPVPVRGEPAGGGDRTGGARPERLRLPSAGGLRLVVGGVAVLVVAAVASQLLAAAWAVFRILQLLAVAAVSGWLGYRLGVVAGRRDS